MREPRLENEQVDYDGNRGPDGVAGQVGCDEAAAEEECAESCVAHVVYPTRAIQLAKLGGVRQAERGGRGNSYPQAWEPQDDHQVRRHSP